MRIRLHSLGKAAAVVAMLAGSHVAVAGEILYTFGADGFGAPTSLNQMDPGSAGSVTNLQTPLGDGNTGFNGGIVYAGGQLFAVGNDSSGNASIYSFSTLGQNLTVTSSDFNLTGDATAFVFQNGLTAIGSSLYAIGAGASGEDLFQIGNGSATLVRSLDTFNGTYAGLAYDPVAGAFYGIVANASGDISGDLLVQFGLSGGTSVVANLTSLDGALTGTHLGGLADAGNGVLYDIFTNINDGNGELEQISLNGTPATSTLYDTNIPLAQNNGIAIASVPEPSLGGVMLAACALILCLKHRRSAQAARG